MSIYTNTRTSAYVRTHARNTINNKKCIRTKTNKCDLRVGWIDLFLFWPIWCTNYAIHAHIYTFNELYTDARTRPYTSCCERVCVCMNVEFQLQFECMFVYCIQHKSEANTMTSPCIRSNDTFSITTTNTHIYACPTIQLDLNGSVGTK